MYLKMEHFRFFQQNLESNRFVDGYGKGKKKICVANQGVHFRLNKLKNLLYCSWKSYSGVTIITIESNDNI